MQGSTQPIKLIVIDIDGTLLDPHRQITQRTRNAIQRAQQAGIIVTLATGRRYRNTAPIASELGLAMPLILCDGAMIMEHPHSQVLSTQLLDASIAHEVVEIFVEHGIQPVLHYINGNAEETWTGHEEFDTQWVKSYFTASSEGLYRVPHAELCTERGDPLRIVAFASREEVYKLSKEICELACAWNIVGYGNYGCSELAVMDKACSKAAGVKTLAAHFGIPLEQVMALGDNNNDIEMLQAVGLGVAMGQAEKHIKAAAHAVTASNAEDGAALAIEYYALQEAHAQEVMDDINGIERTIFQPAGLSSNRCSAD
ncbi:MAG: HAD family phosphatase [Ktedonobacteraceae bacterium]|nr:HAD family phosphatase [Ktedonobacteraceae bacterium]